MSEEVFILIKCSEQTEKSQKYQACTLVERHVKKIKGIIRTYYAGQKDVDITAFAKWNEEDITKYVKEIKNIGGVNEVKAKIIVPA